MKTIRLGIIGMGNIGRHHAGYLMTGGVGRCELVAVCSTSPGKLEEYRARRLGVFDDATAMIRSGTVDAVLIATPHFQHATIGITALQAGLHIMVEKPIAAHKADAERLIAAHQASSGLVFAGMFQLRTEPRYQKLRQLVRDGAIGRLARMSWIMTDWFRTEAYYASSGWRATWKGEGGGVLLNQCLHNLDLMQWLLGMPARVRGFCKLGRYHDIEVEDDVSAILEYPNGAMGNFVSSTGEAPGTNRFEIVGTSGRLVLEKDRITFTRNATDAIDFSRSATQGFVKPDATEEDVPFDNAENPHAILMQNFVNAILDGDPLIAPGAEGIHSVELANAILYSSLMERTIALPMDSAAYETRLNQLIAVSRQVKQVRELAAQDFASSFRR